VSTSVNVRQNDAQIKPVLICPLHDVR